ncbi:MAG: hypothetical protein RI943_721 [Bacteroidota bacterium]
MLSGWQDSNLRPPAPKAGAITGLRYTPKKAERQGLEPWRQSPVDRLAICSVTTPAPLLLIPQRIILFCGCKYRITFFYFQLKKGIIFKFKTNLLNINIIHKQISKSIFENYIFRSSISL